MSIRIVAPSLVVLVGPSGSGKSTWAKVSVLHKHCADEGRDPSQVEITHLGACLVGEDRRHVDQLIDQHLPSGANRHAFASAVNAGTIEDHIGRFRMLAESGVAHAIVGLRDTVAPEAVTRMKDVIAAF